MQASPWRLFSDICRRALCCCEAHIMHLSAHSTQAVKGTRPQLLVTRTTLYDLIAAISAEAQEDEDDVITATMVHLLQTRSVTHLGTFKYRRLVFQPRRASWQYRRKAGITRLRRRPWMTCLGLARALTAVWR